MAALIVFLAIFIVVAFVVFFLMGDTEDAMSDEPILNTRGKDR
jgi:hypothetical protein